MNGIEAIKEICRSYLEEEIQEDEFTRLLVHAINSNELQVEVAVTLETYLDK